ncbi:Uu.00g060880.m01.CDS01 [Anthostomella pinea]|uniref:Glutathione S-transferase kappa n=1 Tax=Anthostomella pinea TaxID=933095 RepID=A0AAI8YMD4_9PEZI|nr:Uu.00g060880.m01.CDS01 [Anthostomella pinea]
MGGRIECYLDIASYYSYVTFIQILKSQELLKQHSVEVEIHPVLIGAINAGSGNKPPWTVKAKAAHSKYDTARSAKAVGLKDASPPGDLMEAGKTQLPMRAMHYIKANHAPQTFTTTLHYLFHAFWTLHRPPNTPAALQEILLEIPADFGLDSLNYNRSSSSGSGGLLFCDEDVEAILQAAASQEYKDALKGKVEEALGRGAFGMPWLWVTTDDAPGAGEPFFGSDRWHFVYEFLGLPYQGVALLPPGGKAKI